MVYSPTRNALSESVRKRITEVMYGDFLGALPPLLLEEVEPRYRSIRIAALRPSFETLREGLAPFEHDAELV